MPQRFVSIWFRHLLTDWHTRCQPALQQVPFVLVTQQHGRIVVTACNTPAVNEGICTGMPLADARALFSGLVYKDDEPGRPAILLAAMAEWCIRFTPVAAADEPDGLLLDVSGCAHLWGSEKLYLTDMVKRFNKVGYHVTIAMADTIGTAWAMARYGARQLIVPPAMQPQAIMQLPPEALRLDEPITERLHKLGLATIGSFMNMPMTALRRRFGPQLLKRLSQALGLQEEYIIPVQPALPYHERLPCLEPIATATGIAIALERLLEALCSRLQQQQKGLRTAIFKGYRVDGKTEQLHIATNRPSHNTTHLFKLFEQKLGSIEPALGIELFTLDAPVVEENNPAQEQLWNVNNGLGAPGLAELLDRISGKFGEACIQRYIPAEHYWPERSFKSAGILLQPCNDNWCHGRPRPVQLLAMPQYIEVTAPVPDYPPMNFRYNGLLHKVINADGPERIEQEWWLQDGQHRDYYCVEDENGCRYWIFRLGHYHDIKYQWFLHGFFS